MSAPPDPANPPASCPPVSPSPAVPAVAEPPATPAPATDAPLQARLLEAFGKALGACHDRRGRDVLHIVLTAQEEQHAALVQELADQRQEYGDQLDRAVVRMSELMPESLVQAGEVFHQSVGKLTGALNRIERLFGNQIDKHNLSLQLLGDIRADLAQFLAIAEVRDLLAVSLSGRPQPRLERRPSVVSASPDDPDDDSDIIPQASNTATPQPELRPRPLGHYFQVGDTFYADENFLVTLEGLSGADCERRAWVPFRCRGHLAVSLQTAAKMLPEQVGSLHRIEPHLVDVSLADLLIELENLGLVSWGGAWPTFPERLAGHVPTGPLTPQTQGRLFEHEGRHYLDEAAKQRVLSRLPVEAGSVLWRDRAFQLVWAPRTAKGDSGGLFLITPVDGAPEDFVARAFAEDLVLHRVARHADAPTTLDEPDTRSSEPTTTTSSRPGKTVVPDSRR